MTGPPLSPVRGVEATRRHQRARDRDADAIGDSMTTEPAQPCTPSWYDLLLVVALSAVISFGGFGLLFADLGHYSAPLVCALGLSGTVVGTALGRPRRIERSSLRRGVSIPAVGAGVVALGQLAWNAADVTHHVVSGQDPGVYLLTGKWIAAHGNLVVPAATSWSGKGDIFSLPSSGMYLMPNGTLQFQFAHMMGVLLALGDNLGGDRVMFRVPAILGAIGLLAIYAVGCRLIRRPWLVLAAVAGIAVSLPELNVTRDSFSEPSTQVLLWGGVFLLLRAHTTRSSGVALLAGLAIGGTLMTHVDAAIYLTPLPVLAMAGLVSARDRQDRRSFLRLSGSALIGVVPTAILGTLDVWHRSGHYYDDLSHQIHSIYRLLEVSTALSVAIAAAWVASPRLARTVRDLGLRYRARLSVVVAWLVGAGLLVTWALRPLVVTQHPTRVAGGTATVQKRLGLPVQPNRTYAEQTLRWFEWYIGPVATALAIVGFCILVVWAIRRVSAPAIIALTMLGGITALYLWNPNVNPLQIWASRRFTTAGFPLFMLAAAVAVDVMATTVGRYLASGVWPRRIAVSAAAGLVAFPLATTWPVRSFRAGANWLPLIEHTCTAIGPDAAVVFAPINYGADILPMTFEDWCHVPAATLVGPEPESRLSSVAAQFRKEGRTLWIIGQSADSIPSAVPGINGALIGAAISPHELAVTLIGPPQTYSANLLSIYGARVP